MSWTSHVWINQSRSEDHFCYGHACYVHDHNLSLVSCTIVFYTWGWSMGMPWTTFMAKKCPTVYKGLCPSIKGENYGGRLGGLIKCVRGRYLRPSSYVFLGLNIGVMWMLVEWTLIMNGLSYQLMDGPCSLASMMLISCPSVHVKDGRHIGSHECSAYLHCMHAHNFE